MNVKKANLPPLDFNMFIQQDNELLCNNDNKNYTQCNAMHRLFAALKYYSMLNISNENDIELLNIFFKEIYCQFIDDYIHFNNYHSHELEKINTELTADNSMFKSCQINIMYK
eukprot:183853_1